ncbi:organ-specific protein P4-like isoform X2 [Amaranthus tricolor]|uniref:organ-specific protein P4-like isoform X2 n=1 Tax=Amaranthus tricolor TaxID=29722 RepID=UPI002589A0DB|nr:organ-specific protein P4-like isoform X2 [Amaranthus tricolor]
MKTFFIFLLSLVLLAGPSDGRKDLHKYWGDMMKGEPMPESLERFIISRSYNKDQYKAEIIKDFLKNYDVSPNEAVKSEHDHDEKSASKKIFADEFEPIINLSVYNQ